MSQTSRSRLVFPLGVALALMGVVALGAALYHSPASEVQFVFTSDAHYGLTRTAFRGHTNVDAAIVNAALVASLNTLPGTMFPTDNGLRAGEHVGQIDFLVEGGDVANRQELTPTGAIQSASSSWAQFTHDYIDGLHTTDRTGARTPIFVVPGNHEASNAVGFYRTMQPSVDAGPMVSIYNLMVHPPLPLQTSTYDYRRDRLFYTREVGGIHFEFLTIWPDSAMRARMEEDLKGVGASTPVMVFTHDQPDAEGKHFINPNGAGDVNANDQFENLLADRFADGPTVDLPSLLEQSELEALLKRHPNLTAYFHGNSNWHQVYEWNGPGHGARLHVFRVDSPMKGAVSSVDETALSFQVVTIDTVARTMTVRECLWNKDGAATHGLTWGDTVTVTLDPRPATYRPT